MTRTIAFAFACAAAACGGSQPATPGAGAPAESAAATPAAASPTAEGAAAASPVAVGATTAALGSPAPGFGLPDIAGSPVKLSDYRGKTVVLEWFNPGCPFIRYAHGEGPLKDASKIPGAGDDSVVWLAINSGAPGKQGHGVELNAAAKKKWGITYPVLMDESGAVGRLYEARSTPHMFVIDPSGTLVYRGALDNAPLGRLGADAPRNYVAEALADVAAGQPVRTPETKSYGCSVKY